jgi:hypothetical protein
MAGMTGTFNASVQAEINGQSTAPIGGATPAAGASTPAVPSGTPSNPSATTSHSSVTGSAAVHAPTSNGASGLAIPAVGALLGAAAVLAL